MLQVGLVFLGGGLGSLCRYAIARVLAGQAFQFPLATLVANIISCLILGYFTGLVLKDNLSMSTRLLVMTGFCGGFSTFSTFTGETFLLMEGGHHLLALLNIAGSVLICLVCFYVGLTWAR